MRDTVIFITILSLIVVAMLALVFGVPLAVKREAEEDWGR